MVYDLGDQYHFALQIRQQVVYPFQTDKSESPFKPFRV